MSGIGSSCRSLEMLGRFLAGPSPRRVATMPWPRMVCRSRCSAGEPRAVHRGRATTAPTRRPAARSAAKARRAGTRAFRGTRCVASLLAVHVRRSGRPVATTVKVDLVAGFQGWDRTRMAVLRDSRNSPTGKLGTSHRRSEIRGGSVTATDSSTSSSPPTDRVRCGASPRRTAAARI